MKKIISSIMLVFVMVFCLNISSVYARPCNEYGQTTCNQQTDDEGNKCSWNGDPKVNSCQAVDASGSYIVDNTPGFLKEDKTVSCGHIKKIPSYLPFITELTINIFTIISLGMLIIMGTIDLFKGVVSGKDDDMKKNRKAFFGRLTSAILLFMIVALTKLLVGFIAKVTGGSFGIAECVDCFINNRCS